MATAYLATLGISAALRARELTGRGQHVDTSLDRGAIASGPMPLMRAEHPDAAEFWTWVVDARAPKGHFECADGRWVLHWPMVPGFVSRVSAGERLEIPDGVSLRARDDPDRIGTGEADLYALDVPPPADGGGVRALPGRGVGGGGGGGGRHRPGDPPARGGPDRPGVPGRRLRHRGRRPRPRPAPPGGPGVPAVGRAGAPDPARGAPGRAHGGAAGRSVGGRRPAVPDAPCATSDPGPARPVRSPGSWSSTSGWRWPARGAPSAWPTWAPTSIKVNVFHDGYWHANHVAKSPTATSAASP